VAALASDALDAPSDQEPSTDESSAVASGPGLVASGPVMEGSATAPPSGPWLDASLPNAASTAGAVASATAASGRSSVPPLALSDAPQALAPRRITMAKKRNEAKEVEAMRRMIAK
jgi:hypothetical protein